MSSRELRIAAFGLACVTVLVATEASAFCRMTTDGGAQIAGAACVERGEPLEWTEPCLSYAIDARGSHWMDQADLETAVDSSFATWMNVDCGGAPPNLIFKPLQASNCRRAEYNCTGNVNTIAFLGRPTDPGEPVEEWKDPCADPDEPGYDRNAFAVTIVWHDTSTGEILDADMMINDQLSSRFNAGGPYDNCPETGCPAGSLGVPGPADLASIVTHEAGHFIGIGHSDLEDSTMFASSDRQSVDKRTLAQDDIDAVCTIYPPGNLDASCNAAPKGGLELDCETEADGSPRACTEASCSTGGSNGCSASGSPDGSPIRALILALAGLIVLRRRSRPRAARCRTEPDDFGHDYKP